MLIMENIINPSKYTIEKELNNILLTFDIKEETKLDIIFLKQAFKLKDIVFIENIEYLIQSWITKDCIIEFYLVNYPIK
jgi:hypothetical protein